MHEKKFGMALASLNKLPKRDLIRMALSLAALKSGNCDDIGTSGAAELCREWIAQYTTGNASTAPSAIALEMKEALDESDTSGKTLIECLR